MSEQPEDQPTGTSGDWRRIQLRSGGFVYVAMRSVNIFHFDADERALFSTIVDAMHVIVDAMHVYEAKQRKEAKSGLTALPSPADAIAEAYPSDPLDPCEGHPIYPEPVSR